MTHALNTKKNKIMLIALKCRTVNTKGCICLPEIVNMMNFICIYIYSRRSSS